MFERTKKTKILSLLLCFAMIFGWGGVQLIQQFLVC